MKNFIKAFCLVVLCFAFGLIYGQNPEDQSQNEEECKVLGEDLKGEYYGKCKKGLANGKGVFKYADGEKIFEGKFKKGKMNGKGLIYVFNKGKKEIVKEGVWKNNKFVGKKKPVAYSVSRTENLDRYTVRKVAEGTKISLNFYQNGSRNSVSNLAVFTNNGNAVPGSYINEYENILFPFKCEVTYTTLSKFKTTTYQVRFEIEINEPGEWDITLFN